MAKNNTLKLKGNAPDIDAEYLDYLIRDNTRRLDRRPKRLTWKTGCGESRQEVVGDYVDRVARRNQHINNLIQLAKSEIKKYA